MKNALTAWGLYWATRQGQPPAAALMCAEQSAILALTLMALEAIND